MTTPTKWPVRPAKTQISLGIYPVWSVFTVCSMDSQEPKASSCGQRRRWSDWADAQADPSLRWAHMSVCWFCHVRIVCQSSHTHQGYLFCCSDIMDTIWLILRVYTDSHWYSVQWFHSEWDHYQFSPLYNNISVLHGHQSIFFIAYTNFLFLTFESNF